MNKFMKGFSVGVLVSASAAAGALLSFKKTVVDPIEEKQNKFKENRKRALRKSRSAHQNRL